MKKITAIIASAMLAIAALACSGGDEATSRPTATETPARTATATTGAMNPAPENRTSPTPPTGTTAENDESAEQATVTKSPATPVPTSAPSATLAPTVAPTPTSDPAPRIDAAKALECLKEFQDLMFNHEPDELRLDLDTAKVMFISDSMAESSENCQQAGWEPVFATELAEPCTKGNIIGNYGEETQQLRAYFFTQKGKRVHTNPTLVRIFRDETTGGPGIIFLIHFEKLPFSEDSGCWYKDGRGTYFYVLTSNGDILREFRDFEFADSPQIREVLGLDTS